MWNRLKTAKVSVRESFSFKVFRRKKVDENYRNEEVYLIQDIITRLLKQNILQMKADVWNFHPDGSFFSRSFLYFSKIKNKTVILYSLLVLKMKCKVCQVVCILLFQLNNREGRTWYKTYTFCWCSASKYWFNSPEWKIRRNLRGLYF